MTVAGKIKSSHYFDSVSLMNVARDLRGLPDVEDAALVMATDANMRLLKQAGLYLSEFEEASPNDLLLVVSGPSSVLQAALAEAESLLSKRRTGAGSGQERRPRTLRAAARGHPQANLAVISVAGGYAVAEAWTALYQGLHVLLFSDNVGLEDEIALKRHAVEHGLLMMGPGAGTAIINGAALGFANELARGPVGIVSAAGTGLQEVSTLLVKKGVGVSQGIGVGGRDLSDPVGGLMMLQALEALQDDHETKVLVVISKLPSPKVVKRVFERLKLGVKPAVTIFMGERGPDRWENGIYRAETLEEAALVAAELAGGGQVDSISQVLEERSKGLEEQARSLRAGLSPEQRFVRGLFSGGTLCEEAMAIWERHLGPVWSNAPLQPDHKLEDSHQSVENSALDLGEEEFTVGRPHPMIDNDLRLRRLLQEAGDATVAAIQLDVVLGYGAHPDPAGELGPAIEQARTVAMDAGRQLYVIGSITGTDGDPQNQGRQRAALEGHGAVIMESNAEASVLTAFVGHGIDRD